MVRSASLAALSISTTKLLPGLKFPRLDNRRIAGLLQGVGNPRCPLLVTMVVADKEILGLHTLILHTLSG